MDRCTPAARAAVVLVAAAVALSLVFAGPAAAAPSGPPFSVSADQSDDALDCPSFQHPDREPVLLVHGTGTRGDEQFDGNWLLALPPMGFDVCVVTYPDRGLGDQQVSAEQLPAAFFQFRRDSRFTTILNTGDETPGDIDWTNPPRRSTSWSSRRARPSSTATRTTPGSPTCCCGSCARGGWSTTCRSAPPTGSPFADLLFPGAEAGLPDLHLRSSEPPTKDYATAEDDTVASGRAEPDPAPPPAALAAPADADVETSRWPPEATT